MQQILTCNNEKGLSIAPPDGNRCGTCASNPGEHPSEERADRSEGGASAPAPILDRYNTNQHTHTTTSIRRRRQKGRAFWLINSCNAWYADKASWWLTLTSAPGQRDIYLSWNALRTRLDRTTKQDIVDWLLDSSRPSFSRKEQRYALEFYLGKDLKSKIDYDYIAIKTSEGNGVYHIFIYGDMLPASWLRHWWKEYHNSSQLRIERIKDDKTSRGKLTKYALTQYAAGQDQFVRLSHSRSILFPQQRKVWLDLVEQRGFDDALSLWRKCMYARINPLTLLQKEKLDAFVSIPFNDVPFASRAHYKAWRAEITEKARKEKGVNNGL